MIITCDQQNKLDIAVNDQDFGSVVRGRGLFPAPANLWYSYTCHRWIYEVTEVGSTRSSSIVLVSRLVSLVLDCSRSGTSLPIKYSSSG